MYLIGSFKFELRDFWLAWLAGAHSLQSHDQASQQSFRFTLEDLILCTHSLVTSVSEMHRYFKLERLLTIDIAVSSWMKENGMRRPVSLGLALTIRETSSPGKK